MANHLRRQIREAAATTLTGLATTGSRVFQMRVYPLQDAELPGLLIYTNSETSERTTLPRPSIMERRLELVVEGYAKANADLDDTLDGIAKEVEVAMFGNPGLTGTAKSATLRASETMLEDGGEHPVGRIRMTWEVLYFASEGAPDVAL